MRRQAAYDNKLRVLKFLSCLSFINVLLMMNVHAAEFSGTLKSQTAFSLGDSRKADYIQQQEWLLDIEYQQPWLKGDITAIGRLRLDTDNTLNQRLDRTPSNYSDIHHPLLAGEHGELNLREFYWETLKVNWFWRLGKQQVVWGEADGLKLLDVINPQSFREFILDDFDDSRIPLWMLNTEWSIEGDRSVQLLWVLDATTHELAPPSSPFAFRSPLIVPQLSETHSTQYQVITHDARVPSSNILQDSDIGGKYTQFIQTDSMGSWDLSLNYLYHYVDTPIVSLRVDNENLVIDQRYERSHLFGGSVSTVIGNWTLRSELAFETDRYFRKNRSIELPARSDQLSSVFGIDWQGWRNQFISFQWFQSTLLQHQPSFIQEKTTHTLSFLWQSALINETLNIKYRQLHTLDSDDGSIQFKIAYNYSDNLDIYLGVDTYYGDKAGLFGQFTEADRWLVGFEWGF